MPLSQPRAKILLALNSPLYAPLLYAIARGRRHRQSSAAQYFSVALATPHAGATPSSPGKAEDSLLFEVLHRNGSIGLTIGVCDPMRLCSVGVAAALDRPRILGTLINKMCFWVFDTIYNEEVPWYQAFNHVIVHPVGFTGYTAAAYDLLQSSVDASNPGEGPQRSSQAAPRFPTILKPTNDPNHEKRAYDEVLLSSLKSRKKDVRPAFISTNPVHAVNKNDPDHSMFSSFLSASAQNRSPRPEFQNVAMTSLIVAARHLDETGTYQFLADFREEISEATRDLYNNPEAAAIDISFYLKDHSLGNTDEGTQYLGASSRQKLASCLELLAESQAFNRDPLMRISPQALQHTIAIRAAVSDLLGPLHRLRKPGSVGEYFYESLTIDDGPAVN